LLLFKKINDRTVVGLKKISFGLGITYNSEITQHLKNYISLILLKITVFGSGFKLNDYIYLNPTPPTLHYLLLVQRMRKHLFPRLLPYRKL